MEHVLLIFSVGTPTPLAYWGFTAIQKLSRLLLPGCHYVHARNLDQFIEGMGAREGRSVIFSSDYLPAKIMPLLEEFHPPLILIEDSLENTTASLLSVRGLPFTEAAFLAERSRSQIRCLRRTSSVLHMASDSYDRTAFSVLGELARYIGPEVDDVRLMHIGEQLLLNDPPPFCSSVREQIVRGGWPHEFLPDIICSRLAADIEGSISELAERCAAELGSGKVEFDPKHFIFGSVERDDTGTFELAGPQRRLVATRPMSVPPGDWAAKFVFETVGNQSQNYVKIEVCNRLQTLQFVKFLLPTYGVYACEVPFRVLEDDLLTYIQVSLVGSAIEARLKMQSLVFKKML